MNRMLKSFVNLTAGVLVWAPAPVCLAVGVPLWVDAESTRVEIIQKYKQTEDYQKFLSDITPFKESLDYSLSIGAISEGFYKQSINSIFSEETTQNSTLISYIYKSPLGKEYRNAIAQEVAGSIISVPLTITGIVGTAFGYYSINNEFGSYSYYMKSHAKDLKLAKTADEDKNKTTKEKKAKEKGE